MRYREQMDNCKETVFCFLIATITTVLIVMSQTGCSATKQTKQIQGSPDQTADPGISVIEKPESIQNQPTVSGTETPLPTRKNTSEPITITETSQPEITETKESQSIPSSQEIPSVQFSIPESNQNLPLDIRDEAVYFLPGGEGPPVCYGDTAYFTPEIIASENNPEITGDFWMMTCGWQSGEKVELTIRLPNGSEIPETYTGSGEEKTWGQIYVYYPIAFDAQKGAYEVKLNGNSGNLRTSFTIQIPDHPRIYKHNGLILLNFQPNEHIRLFAYENGSLTGWKGFHVDHNGSLNIQIAGHDFYNYVVIGEKSGEHEVYNNRFLRGFPDHTIQVHTNVKSCPGAPEQQFKLNDLATICTKSDSMIIRSGPGKSQNELFRVPPGSSLKIIGGPVCEDNFSWWQIQVRSGKYRTKTGWIAEGGDEIDPYFICPAD